MLYYEYLLLSLESKLREDKCLCRILRIFLFSLVFVASFAFQATSVFAYPPYAANSDLVVAGPYDTATSGEANIGAGETYREFITIGQQYRIRQNGTISRIRLFVSTPQTGGDITHFYLKVWRKNGSNYDLVGTSNDLASSLIANQFNTVDLTTTITAQEGDFYGYRVEELADAWSLYAKLSVTGTKTYYVTGSTPSDTNYNWAGQSVGDFVFPIELYMQAPQFVFIGNSIIAGHPAHNSFLEADANLTTNLASTIEQQFGILTSYTYQNMGIGSQTTTNISSRFTADVLNLKPKVIVIEGGVNDIAQSVAKSTFIANWTSMLDAAQNDSSVSSIVILKILPWTNGTNTQMQTRDDWNNSLATLAASYSKAIVVDASSYVGQFRSGGDAGNLWDIKTAYNQDGVHFNQAGHGQIAQAIADSLDSIAPTITSVTSTTASGYYTTGQAINVTVNFSENITSTGNVTVTLNTTPSRTCTFTVSSTNTGSCTYTVQAGDMSAGLDASEISGTIKDGVLNSLTNFTPATVLSASKTIVIDTTAPSISSVSSGIPTSSEATITWTTNENSSSKVEYGLTNSYGSITPETDTSPRVPSHSVILSSFSDCVTYHYRVRSKDAATNERIGTDNTFTTNGCTASASATATASAQITTASGGSLTLQNSNSYGLTLTVPSSFAASDANFQAHQLDKTTVLATTSSPTGYSAAGSYIFELKALTDNTTTVSTFDNALTASIAYGASDVSSLDESTLKIYRWDGSSWNQLTGCSVNTSTKTVTCTTTLFSVFGIFGRASTSSSSSNSSSTSSSTSTPSCGDQTPGAKTPWLYGAIAQDSSSVLLYFTEADNPVNKYVLEYGIKSGNYLYGVQDMGVNSRGQMTFLVKSLSRNTTYYFRVRGGNGCATGLWSNEISATTKGLITTNNLDIVSSELIPVITPTQAEIVAPSATNKVASKSYEVKIKVVDTSNQPVAGAKVTLNSIPRNAVTDKNGLADFQNVEPGEHKVLIVYDGYKGEQSISLDGDVKEFDLTVKVQRESISLSPIVIGIVGVMALVIIVLIVLLIKAKRKD